MPQWVREQEPHLMLNLHQLLFQLQWWLAGRSFTPLVFLDLAGH